MIVSQRKKNLFKEKNNFLITYRLSRQMNKLYSNFKSLLPVRYTKSRRIVFEHLMTSYDDH
jgi:hypothetical protein